jgi:hypothetical protein
LNQNEKTDDPDEQNRALKACHQRCANRTLKVLEKNGSVFIKLGQHLVWWKSYWYRSALANYSIECNELPPATGMDDDLYPLAG